MSACFELSIPSAPDHLYLVRLHVGAIGARAGMSIEDVEDLRLAVDELCLSLLDPRAAESGRLHVAVTLTDGQLDVRCRLALTQPAADPAERNSGLPESLSAHILDALVDAHGSVLEDGDRVSWLSKRWARGVVLR